MSQENVELVKRMLERFHAGDAEGSLTCFSAEVDTRYVMLFQVRDGELSRMSLHADPAAALEAAGLAE